MRFTRYLGPGLAAVLAVALAGQSVAQDRPDRENRRAARFVSLYDTGGDGKVSLKEIAAEQKRLLGAADIDGDKALSVEEFRRRGRLFVSMGTTTMFDLLDVNGDRKISAAELAAPSRRWFKRYDANRDGAITAKEIPGRPWRGGPHRPPRRR